MKKVIIIGGGFAGLNLAKKLSKSNHYQITVVDQNNYHFFPPLLYQVGTAFIEPSNISYPFRKMFSGKKIRFFMGKLETVEATKNRIITDNGVLTYDLLIFAMGTETNYFGNEQITQNALPMKSIEDALKLRNHILLQIEKAVRSESALERKKFSTIVIAGGGPTGVELAGMMAEMAIHITKKDYPEVQNAVGKVYLIDGQQTLLAPMSTQSQNEAFKVLKKLGVEVILGTMVKGFDGAAVSLSDGVQIEAATLIWASGVIAREVKGLPADVVGRGRRILVDEFNQVKGLKNVYAIGDQCLQTSDAQFQDGHPQLAQVAIQQGSLLGKNLAQLKQGQSMKPFVYNDKGSMAIIAKFKAVVDLPKGFMKGFLAWIVWLLIHIIPIAGYRNKAKLAFNWLWSFMTNDPPLRLIFRTTGKKVDQKGNL